MYHRLFRLSVYLYDGDTFGFFDISLIDFLLYIDDIIIYNCTVSISIVCSKNMNKRKHYNDVAWLRHNNDIQHESIGVWYTYNVHYIHCTSNVLCDVIYVVKYGFVQEYLDETIFCETVKS